MDVNVSAVFQTTQAFLPLLETAAATGDRGPARVINIASINGIDPPINLDTFAYSSSKAAVVMLSRHMAARLAPTVLVNALCPGPFRSRMMRGTLQHAGESAVAENTLVKRLGSPADIVGAALLLCSQSGSFITGTSLPVDGGALLSKF